MIFLECHVDDYDPGVGRYITLATAATACRAMAYQERERAKQMANPNTRGPIESAAHRYAALAEKLQAARERCEIS